MHNNASVPAAISIVEVTSSCTTLPLHARLHQCLRCVQASPYGSNCLVEKDIATVKAGSGASPILQQSKGVCDAMRAFAKLLSAYCCSLAGHGSSSQVASEVRMLMSALELQLAQ